MASDPPKNTDPATEKDKRSSSMGSAAEFEHTDYKERGESSDQNDNVNNLRDRERLEASSKLANPLAGLSMERLASLGEDYARKAGLTSEEDIRAFRLGAMIAGNDNRHDGIAELTDAEREVIDRETTHKWSNPKMLYWVIISKCLCRLSLSLQARIHPNVETNSLLALRGGTRNGRDRSQWRSVLLQGTVRHRRLEQ